jgi:hypothetical protein
MFSNRSEKLSGERRPTSMNFTTTSLATLKIASSVIGLPVSLCEVFLSVIRSPLIIRKMKSHRHKEGQFFLVEPVGLFLGKTY